MAITHVSGDFFSPEHNDMHRSFGFKESARGAQGPDFPDTKTGKSRPEPEEEHEGAPGDYAVGGKVHPHHHPHGHHVARVEDRDGMKIEHHDHGGMTVHHDDGHVSHHHHDGSPVHAATGGHMGMHMHPHGHDVEHVEHREHDGAVIHHHHHGGHSVHHADGRVTHHHGDGSPVHSAPGGMEHMHDPEGEYAHGGHARHNDEAQDRALIKEMVGRHDKGEAMAFGGHARLPRAMKPAGMRPHSPIETAPRKPQVTRTPPNSMPGGVMGYGTQPGAEPGMEPTDPTGGTGPGMRHGGHAKRRERERE